MSDQLEKRIEGVERRLQALSAFVVPALWSALRDSAAERGPRRPPRCLACDSGGPFKGREAHCAFGGGLLQRLECPACGGVFGPTHILELSPELIAADYSLLYSSYPEADSSASQIRAFHALEPDPRGTYLNWGAGSWSSSVSQLREAGWDVWGYEPHVGSDSPFVVNSIDAISATFDGIFSNNVLEHMIDPAGQFEQFRSMMKPEASMSHATPCYDWRYANTRFHVFFPMGRAAEALAARTGYRVTAAQDDDDFRVRVFQKTR